jgi:CelD/BcsL family acetyltransferase involved in cellulose biosynthesis
MGELRLREISTLEELAGAREAWTDLIDRAAGATPFQTWEWVFGFARYDRCRPRVLVLEESSGRWAGALPLCDKPSMIPGVGQLELIGGRLSDYPGLLAEPALRAACEERLRLALVRLLGRPVGSLRSQQEVPPLWLPTLPYRIVARDESVVVPLASSAEAFMQSLSAKFRSNLRRNQRRLAAARVEFHTPADEGELRAAMPTLFHLHQLRKNSQGERGRFYEARWCEAITEIAVSLQARNVTRLTVLRIDDAPAAASFDLRLHGTQYTYQYGMNPELRAFSPGKLLTLRMLEDAMAAGMRRYDFGRGLEEYKLQWSKERREVYDVLAARSPAVLAVWSLLQEGHSRLLRNRLLKSAYLAVRGREPLKSSPEEAESEGP